MQLQLIEPLLHYVAGDRIIPRGLQPVDCPTNSIKCLRRYIPTRKGQKECLRCMYAHHHVGRRF